MADQPAYCRADQISAVFAIKWLAWAAQECQVPMFVARPDEPAPIRAHPYRRLYIPWSFAGDIQKRSRIRQNYLPLRQARDRHLQRCRVAHFMASTPHPYTGKIASLAMISFVMRWGGKKRAFRAVGTWERELAKTQPKQGDL